MRNTPKGFRLHIGLFGASERGKIIPLVPPHSQTVSIVSDVAGTTTDPVEKPMELLPIGAVLFIDTAGIDDVGALGEMRVQKTKQVFDRTDVGIIVTIAGEWGEFEEKILTELRERKIPVIVVFQQNGCGCRRLMPPRSPGSVSLRYPVSRPLLPREKVFLICARLW